MKVMLVEDDSEVRELASQLLSEQGFEVIALPTGEQLVENLQQHRPNILLMDQMLPGKSGVECVRELRGLPQYQLLPIIMVTGLGSEQDIVAALESGADDYVTKPFMPKELGARIKAVTRRRDQQPHSLEKLDFKDLSVDFTAHRVVIGGSEVSVTLTEFRILAELLIHQGQVLTREILRERALGNLNVTDRTIDVHMAALRRKLAHHGSAIRTIRGVGYRFSEE